MEFIDVHTHLHDRRIVEDIREIINQAVSVGVNKMVTCATMEENFDATVKLAKEYKAVLPCFGIHPWFIGSLTSGWEERLGTWLETIPSGVGETGLDFMDKGADREFQNEVFKTHLDLAVSLGRPINIHIRKAWDAFLHILKKNGPLKAGGLVHSYSGSADLAKVLERYNLHISFSGSVTRPNAKKVVKALNAVSLDRILFETDTPDIPPTFENGHRAVSDSLNYPGNLPYIVEIAARKRGVQFEELGGCAYTNGLNLFESIMK